MAGIDLATAQQKLNEWLDADTAVAKGQAYTVGGRSVTRANAREIRENIDYWNAKVAQLSRGGIRIRGAIPC